MVVFVFSKWLWSVCVTQKSISTQTNILSPAPQHSPTDASSDASTMLPDRPVVGASAGQPISTEQSSDQEMKPKKKKKKKAKVADGEEDDDGKKLAAEGAEDVKSVFPGSGIDAAQQVTDMVVVEGSSSPVEEKKKRKKKPKDKKEGKEPKEPKTPKMPKTPKTPKDPKEKKAKSSTPKPKTPKKTR